MSAHAPARTGRKKPEEVIGKGNVDWLAKDTMGYFLSKEFKKYELLERPLPTRYDVKSAYYAQLLNRLRDRYGAALAGTDPPLGKDIPRQLEYVSRLTMAKFDETVRDYADSILNTKYDALARRLKALAAMTDEEKQQAAWKKNIQHAAPPKHDGRRRTINPKGQSYI